MTAREKAAYIAMLEDSVVAAAVLWFGEAEPNSSHADYLSEGLHEMASEICNTVPRLKGAYKGASS